jgi:hypothetical protein
MPTMRWLGRKSAWMCCWPGSTTSSAVSCKAIWTAQPAASVGQCSTEHSVRAAAVVHLCLQPPCRGGAVC